MNYILKNEFYTFTVSSYGAEIISGLDALGNELMWQSPSPELWSSHAPILFPVCGRLVDETYKVYGEEYHMKIHGFARKNEWDVTEASDTCLTLTFSDTEETRMQYPFSFKLVARYELMGEKLSFTFSVTNDSERVMPYMFGWHPGFKLPDGVGPDIEDYRVEFKNVDAVNWYPILGGTEVQQTPEHFPLNNSAYVLNEKQIYENDTMIFTGHGTSCSLYAEGHPFRIDMEWSENLPLLCIWKEPLSSARFLCIEPWSNLIGDGVSKEDFDKYTMPRLAPSKTETYRYTVSIKTR